MASTGGTMPPPNRISTSLVALVLSLAGPAVEEPPTLAPAEPVERVIQAAEQRNCPAPVANRIVLARGGIGDGADLLSCLTEVLPEMSNQKQRNNQKLSPPEQKSECLLASR
jgi:hypothetical protein